jgi:hypothetical protein
MVLFSFSRAAAVELDIAKSRVMERRAPSRRDGIPCAERALGKIDDCRCVKPGLGYDPLAYCVENDLGRIVEPKFLQNLISMGFDRIDTDIQKGRYFFVCFPFS